MKYWKKQGRRGFAWFLAFVMCLSMLQHTVYTGTAYAAQDKEVEGSGAGSGEESGGGGSTSSDAGGEGNGDRKSVV